MKTDKAFGPSEITLELFRAIGHPGIKRLKGLLNKLWLEEVIPEDWKRSTMIPIYKGKGNILECGNRSGIKLLEHGMVLYERILDRRLMEAIKINEMQCGFMPGKGITNAI